ncbi:MAG: NUDIX domain-containing protein [Burkholderiales bacterium]|jgi:8-oxo-dGTP diphosphatase|nr:NUDIX domain-containing protein [Burkholderiales bacterium]
MNIIINACLGILYQAKGNQVLLASRPEGKVLAGHWEFPGGKLELGEDTFTALTRELNEELGIIVHAENMCLIGNVEHQYSHGLACLDLIVIKQWDGDIQALEGQQFCWCKLDDNIRPEPLLPTTIQIFELIKNEKL